MNLKINRKHIVDVENIQKIIEKENCYWVYLKKGYPKILKSDESKYSFRLKCVNSKIDLKDILK